MSSPNLWRAVRQAYMQGYLDAVDDAGNKLHVLSNDYKMLSAAADVYVYEMLPDPQDAA